ncbi:MAG: ABC transporter permease [Rhodothermales bacterium]|nr:ABC transporter permease [Rhodothermales bacterium]
MRLADLVRLARQNLLRNRTRSLLTLGGVAVGVAALLTLVAYGKALQENARGEFEALELYHTLRVTSLPSPFEGMGAMGANVLPAPTDSVRREVPLTDSLVQVLANVGGVEVVYPESVFPSKILANGREAIANVEGIPATFARYPAYRPTQGRYFESDTARAVLLSPVMTRRLGYARPEDALGDSITVVTASLNLAALQTMAGALAFGLTTMPFNENHYKMGVVGLLPEDGQPITAFARVLVPLGRANRLQKVTFFSTIDLLMRRSSAVGGYAALRVQVDQDTDFDAVRAAIEAHGIYTSAFRDQFAQLDRLFVIVDMALAIVGLIALLVATLGIANTMAMNVVERRREIGVMKAVGGDERDIQRVFVAESALLGLFGGVAGLLLGGLVMGGIQLVISAYLRSKGLPDVHAFAPTVPMALGVVAVAAAVSLVAGWAPARRAARTEPVEALRSL